MVSKRQGWLITLAALVPMMLPTTVMAESKAILPATSYCDDGSIDPAQQRRRPGVPIDEYELPPCEEADESRITAWVDPFDLGPTVPDRYTDLHARSLYARWKRRSGAVLMMASPH